MRRNPDHTLVAKPLNTFQILTHDISEPNSVYEDNWICMYENIEVYTDKGTPVIAQRYCDCADLSCYDKSGDTNTSRVWLKDSDTHKQKVTNRNWNMIYDAHTNCFGACMLDGIYWLNLTPQTIKTIMTDDAYTEVPNTFVGDHIVIYYKDSQPAHIARYNVNANGYNHKPGCREPVFRNDADASFAYQYDEIKLYARV